LRASRADLTSEAKFRRSERSESTGERSESHLSEAILFIIYVLFTKPLFIYNFQPFFKTSYPNQKTIFRFYCELPELTLRAKRNLGGVSAANRRVSAANHI
jgi:hypothetical protein